MYFPFNHQPVARKSISSTYTADMTVYGRVTLQWTGYIDSQPATPSGVATAHTGWNGQGSQMNDSISFWIGPGDTVTLTDGTVSRAASFTEVGGAGTRTYKADSTNVSCGATVTSVSPAGVCPVVDAKCHATQSVDSITTIGNGAANYGTFSGAAVIIGYVEEYLAPV